MIAPWPHSLPWDPKHTHPSPLLGCGEVQGTDLIFSFEIRSNQSNSKEEDKILI